MNLHNSVMQPVPTESTGVNWVDWDEINQFTVTCLTTHFNLGIQLVNTYHILELNKLEWHCIISLYSLSRLNPLAGNKSTGMSWISSLSLAWAQIISWYNFSQHHPHPGSESSGMTWYNMQSQLLPTESIGWNWVNWHELNQFTFTCLIINNLRIQLIKTYSTSWKWINWNQLAYLRDKPVPTESNGMNWISSLSLAWEHVVLG
jgi:hypothetical protein